MKSSLSLSLSLFLSLSLSLSLYLYECLLLLTPPEAMTVSEEIIESQGMADSVRYIAENLLDETHYKVSGKKQCVSSIRHVRDDIGGHRGLHLAAPLYKESWDAWSNAWLWRCCGGVRRHSNRLQYLPLVEAMPCFAHFRDCPCPQKPNMIPEACCPNSPRAPS